MPKPLVFMMGRAPAILPTDRLYAHNHMWAAPAAGEESRAGEAGGDPLRFGLSAFAVRLLGDVEIVEWSAGPGSTLAAGEPMGTIEGSKAASQIVAPAAGVVLAFNLNVITDPTLINSNLYDQGWLFVLRCSNQEFLGPAEYLEHLNACWPLAQRMLEGTSGPPDCEPSAPGGS